MKLSAQQKKMKEIYDLLSQDLSYIYGERESGPNGAKKEFLRKTAEFLRRLGKDLGFIEMRVHTNKAGIACSGEVTLYGMWSKNNGMFFEITQSLLRANDLLYREIESLNDFKGGQNKWLSISMFRDMEYSRLCVVLLELKKEEEGQDAA